MARQVPRQMPVWGGNGVAPLEKREDFVPDQMNLNQTSAGDSHGGRAENAGLRAQPCDNSRLAAAQPMAGARG